MNSAPDVQLEQSDGQGVIFTLDVPSYTMPAVSRDGIVYQQIILPGWGHTGEPGRPQIPVRSVMLAIPPDALLSLEVQAQDETFVPCRYWLLPTPRLTVDSPLAGPPHARDKTFTPDETFYAQADEYPPHWATIDPPAWIRQQRVVVVRLTPFRYRPATNMLHVAPHLRVVVRFRYPEGTKRPPQAEPSPDPFAPSLRPHLLNANVAASWQFHNAIPKLATAAGGWQPDGHKIIVDHDGLFRLTYTATLAANIDVTADPRTYKLYQGGQEVALYVSGESDGSFDPQDEIRFYGRQAHTRYTNRNVYWLVTGGGAGLRMTTRDGTAHGNETLATAFTTTLLVEENHLYSSITPRGEGHDHWFWDFVLAYGKAEAKTFPFTVTQIATEPFSATVQGALAGATSLAAYPDHHTQVFLNGRLLDDAIWDGQTAHFFTATIPSDALLNGHNAISVALPFDLGLPYDDVYADRFELQFHRTYTVADGMLSFGAAGPGKLRYRLPGLSTPEAAVLDITDPLHPVRILSTTLQTGAYYTLTFADDSTADSRYLIVETNRLEPPVDVIRDRPSDLRSVANGADYIIITHEDFYTAVLPLRDHRVAQGMRVQVVRVQDIYDEFNFGLPDARAIHDFLAYAYAHWEPPAPAYILLVGDGSLDPKDYLHTGVRSYIPPYLATADPWINEVAADNRYVDVHGNDHFPDMYLGRMPANSAAEATTMVSKTLAYEQNPPPGLWNRRILFVADNADSSADFAAFSNEIAALLPPGYLPERVYYGVTHTTVGQARGAIIHAINDGQLLVHYAGHAASDAWAAEKIFGLPESRFLTNTNTLPIMLPMTCYDGFYDYPKQFSLGESIVRMAAGGAVASWSPTGLGVDTGHTWLDMGFFDAVFGQGVNRLGPATMAGLLNLYQSTPNFHELIDTYVLFGDPALRLPIPYCNGLGAADINCDCRVDTEDVQAAAVHWPSRAGKTTYRSALDVDDSGTIDIFDLMSVAALWGETCPP